MLSFNLPSVAAAAAAKTSISASISATVPLLFPCSSTVRAPLRFVLESLFLIESLFAFSKNEFTIAIFAS